jgi:hypothetical protein
MLPVISGTAHETTRSVTLAAINGDPLCGVARTPRVTAHDAVATAREEGFEALQAMSVRELLDRVATAGQLLLGEGTPANSQKTDCTSFEQYQRCVVRATGLPAGWVRMSSHWLAFGLRHAAESLRAHSPTGDLDVYNDPAYTRETDIGLAFAPRIRVLGAMMPANDPAVYAWPALALAMKVPIVLRPSDRDPVTAVRLGRALRSAGVPDAAIHVLPGDRSIGDTVCRKSDHAMVFGTEESVASFRTDPSVETYGPGNSVAVLARDPTSDELDTLARGITRAGGRACFCLTRILATGDCDADELADRLAHRVVAMDGTECGPLLAERTGVPAFSRDTAYQLNDTVTTVSGRDITAAYRNERLIEQRDVARLQPTVLRTDELVPELPFQFAGVTKRDRNELGCFDSAYLAVVIGSEEIERTLVRSPGVKKVYGGRYPATVDLRETHETSLTSFLYQTTTYDPGQ